MASVATDDKKNLQPITKKGSTGDEKSFNLYTTEAIDDNEKF